MTTTPNKLPRAAGKASKPGRDDPEQSRLFIDKAREIGADEEKSAADELLGQLAKLPPERRTKKLGG